jgi:hypothetical protein
MKITRTSPFSKKQNSMDLDITQEQLDRWQSGEMIQDVFPHLSADEREFLKTGITKAEWDDLFGGDSAGDHPDDDGDYRDEEDDGHNGY